MLSTPRAEERSGMQPCQTGGGWAGTWASMCWWVSFLLFTQGGVEHKRTWWCSPKIRRVRGDIEPELRGELVKLLVSAGDWGSTMGLLKTWDLNISWTGECWCQSQPGGAWQSEYKSPVPEVIPLHLKLKIKHICQSGGWKLDANTTVASHLCPQRVMGGG